MKVVSMPRGMGKTTKLLAWVLEDPENRVLLVFSQEEKDRLIRQLSDDGLYPDKITSQSIETWDRALDYGGLLVGRSGKNGEPLQIAIDNADIFLSRYFSKRGNPIAVVSLSSEKEL